MGYNYTTQGADPYKTHVYYSNFARYGGILHFAERFVLRKVCKVLHFIHRHNFKHR